MSREGNFLVYCMECYRRTKGLTGREVSHLFSRHGVSDYVMRFFESLHTTGERYIVADIDAYLAQQ